MTLVSNIGRRKRNLGEQKGDSQLSTKEKADGEARKTRDAVLGDMDAIGCGVEAWFEENIGYSRVVLETTMHIARALGVPEGEIERWASSRTIRDGQKTHVVKSLLEGLQQSFAQADDNGNTTGK